MKSLKINTFLTVLGLLAFASCDPKIDAPTPSVEGKLDLSNYIAIGNSLTAGYASNGLYLEGQKVAYPVLLAQQFKLAGGGEFYAPLFDADQADGTGYLRLDGFLSPTSPILTSVPGSPNAVLGKSPLAYNSSLNPDSLVLKSYSGTKINNFGVPGIRVADIDVVGYGWPNSYFGRMLTQDEKSNKSYSSKVLEQNPTFFSCWLGNNDVLGYSTAGGAALIASITPKSVFEAKFSKLISDLGNLPTDPKGVLVNIPDVTSIPFFTTVGPSVKSSLPSTVPAFYEFKFDSVFNKVAAILANPSNPGVTILDTSKGSPVLTSRIATLNSLTGNFDGDVFFTLTFSPYASDLGKPKGTAWRTIIKTLIKQFNLPSATEQAIWLHSGLDTTQAFGFSIRNPVPDVYVLNSQETTNARTAVSDFNQIIKNAAEANDLGFVDANSFLKGITKGSYYDAISTNASFLSGGVFSLDGVHLTPKGNALAANELIKAINNKYNTKITVLNPGQFKGVTFP
jgi:hypothetical protein